MNRWFFAALLVLLLFRGSASALEPSIASVLPVDGAIGLSSRYFKESDLRLSLEQAVARFEHGQATASDRAVLNFGIGSKPVWIHFSLRNNGTGPVLRRLSIDTAWLDRVDLFVRHAGTTVASHVLGDGQPFDERPVKTRQLGIDHAFAAGLSDIYLRVQTPDPMVIPIHVLSLDEVASMDQWQAYSYGFLYGFLFALLAYNATLYASLRDRRYLLYSLYLGMFILANLSYTGHGFQWLWPTQPGWAQWSNPLLMLLYGISGLLFALRFLSVRRYFPRLHKAVLAYCGAGSVLLAYAALVNDQAFALLVAFTFIFLFTLMMLVLGLISVRAGQKPARFFLLAALAAMLGAGVTTLAVWGYIPYTPWTFRAVDIGMLLDSTLLALALAYQFRISEADKDRAELLARLDPLTGLNNRRAFNDKALPVWNGALRHDRALSLVLLDLDNFKRVNDIHGHAVGDEVLVATAKVLLQSIRLEDVVARWGGEEFILLLPETDRRKAVALAERLRLAMTEMRIRHADQEIRITASFGVVQREPRHPNLDALISSADRHLYQAKHLGRNRVSHDGLPET